MAVYHNPVMLKESINLLLTNKDGIYVDVTFGGGGHSKEILKNCAETAKLFAFDQDDDALTNQLNDSRFTLINANFKYLKAYLKYHQISNVDGILADLGVSSHQFDEADRGFSIRFDDAPLDARMSKSATSLTAASILNEYSVESLKKVFQEYGELKNAFKIANSIVEYRRNNALKTVTDLKNAIFSCIPKFQENKFLAQIMQALRIEINQELDVLKEMLIQASEILKPKGRLVVISYHSLEDRLVKNFIKSGNFEGSINKDFFGNIIRPLAPLQQKAIAPNAEEIDVNNRARSAKLRAAEKN